jgi:O-antigen/teichoic acid export membrane protein
MTTDENADIAKRAVSGSAYSIASSVITISLGIIRSILLARFLLPEHFGVVALALVFLNFSAQIRSFGLDNALIQRQDTNEELFATYFTLRQATVILPLGALALLVPVIGRFYLNYALLVPILYAFIVIDLFKSFNTIQVTILNKQMAFKLIAIVDIVSSVTMTIIAPVLAYMGFGVWSLVAERATSHIIRIVATWILYRPWRPQFGWNSQIARELWQFGMKLWMAGNINFLLDSFDDFWIATFLGKIPAGYYDRAYEFSNYPRRVISNPLTSVFFATFARLQNDRVRLSRAFFRSLSLMVRTGFWFSLLFISIAPEGIELFLEAKWLPMVTTFQLMILYTLLDPLIATLKSLLIAVGQAGLILRTKVFQFIIFVPSVILLAKLYGIEGVAIAADMMIVVGTFFLFRHVGKFVDYSRHTLWGWPVIALLLSAGTQLLLTAVWQSLPLWGSLLGKGIIISTIYWGVLLLMEREELNHGWQMVWGLVSPRLRERMGRTS